MAELNVKQKFEKASDILGEVNNRLGRRGFYIFDVVDALYDFDKYGQDMDKDAFNNLIEKLEWQAIKLAEAAELVKQIALEARGE